MPNQPSIRRVSGLIAAALAGSAFVSPPPFAQTHDVTAIQNLKCLANDTIAAGSPFPAVLRAACNGGDSTWRSADTAIEADNFRVTYNPYGNLEAVDGDAECVGACLGGRYERHPSPDQDFKNVRNAEGSRAFLDTTTLIKGEDIIVHLPKGFNGPREHALGLANGNGTRDVLVMLHGGGGLGEAALSQLANMRPIQDLPGNGPVLLVPNSGNNLKMLTHQWAWDSWNNACQTQDTSRLGGSSLVRFRDYGAQSAADPVDDGFDDACASDLKRLLKLVADLKAHNKWVRHVVLAGFSSGGSMTRTVFCTYPGAYDGYAMFQFGKLIGASHQSLCGDLDASATGYAGFLSARLDTLLGARPQDLAAFKRPLFHVCSNQDDACSDDLGGVWRVKGGVADTLVTDLAVEKRVIDHTEVNDLTRANFALERVPDSADLATLGIGQFNWKASGLAYRAQTTQASNLPPGIGALVAANNVPPVCADSRSNPGAYDTDLCSFADANAGGGPQAADDHTFHSVLALGRAGQGVVSPPDDIVAVRYVEKRNGSAYGYIEVHGGGHTVHGTNHRADFGKSRDFETFIELVKFMRYALADATAIRRTANPPARRPGLAPAFSGVMRFQDRNALGRRAALPKP